MRTSRQMVRVELARGRLQELDLAIAKGLEGVALEVLQTVRAPDATPFGEGLVDQGGFISYVDAKRVGGDADAKPKGLRAGKGAMAAVGFGFPGRFQEMGTVRQPPRPFLSPVVMGIVGSNVATQAIARACASMLQRKSRGALTYRLKG